MLKITILFLAISALAKSVPDKVDIFKTVVVGVFFVSKAIVEGTRALLLLLLRKARRLNAVALLPLAVVRKAETVDVAETAAKYVYNIERRNFIDS